jgi:tetratricopeptide (TPR) repeat protein
MVRGSRTISFGKFRIAGPEQSLWKGLTVLRNSANRWDLGIVLSTLGLVARLQGRPTDAAALYQESAGVLRAIPDPWSLSYPLRALASLAASAQDYDQAEAYWRESLPLLRTSGENWQLALSIKGLAETSFVRGDQARAVRLFAAAEALEENVEIPSYAVQNDSEARWIAELRRALGPSLFSSLWDQGRRLSRDEIFALASGPAANKVRRVRRR